jgi:RNA polymerase sigma-70 factor (TIGR02943 family)
MLRSLASLAEMTGVKPKIKDTTPQSEALGDPSFIEDLRAQMLKFATLQLSNMSLAEDVVQEALVGALKNARSFGGRAALKTWVFAILKNKIADALRQRQRQGEISQLLNRNEEEWEELFDRKGFWKPHERPAAWGDPEAAIRDQHFWRVFETCLEHLPGQQAQVFMMREFVEMESQEICTAVGISGSNLNVMLHRARLRLRECLENHWFLPGGSAH